MKTVFIQVCCSLYTSDFLGMVGANLALRQQVLFTVVRLYDGDLYADGWGKENCLTHYINQTGILKDSFYQLKVCLLKPSDYLIGLESIDLVVGRDSNLVSQDWRHRWIEWTMAAPFSHSNYLPFALLQLLILSLHCYAQASYFGIFMQMLVPYFTVSMSIKVSIRKISTFYHQPWIKTQNLFANSDNSVFHNAKILSYDKWLFKVQLYFTAVVVITKSFHGFVQVLLHDQMNKFAKNDLSFYFSTSSSGKDFVDHRHLPEAELINMAQVQSFILIIVDLTNGLKLLNTIHKQFSSHYNMQHQ